MIKKIICCVVIMGMFCSSREQNTKSTKSFNQLWFGYHNQVKLTDKWELSGDIQLRTRENFVEEFSQSIFRLGLSWYLNPAAKFSAGYAYSSVYGVGLNKKLTQPEHRPWQQFQWEAMYGKKRLVQRFRLEERFRKRILNDGILGKSYEFNFRMRYNIGFEIPFSKKGIVPKSLSLVLNEDININFSKETVYNYFDQNRLFIGVKYQIDRHNHLTVGYMDLFQQTAAGNKYVNINAFRFIYIQNLDLRIKQSNK